jgi:CHAT domain-containing protein
VNDPPAPASIADNVVSIPDQVARLRVLRGFERCFAPELVEEFRRRAEETLRRDPREAGRLAHLGLAAAESIRFRPGRLGCLVERAKAALLCGDSRLALESATEAGRIARELSESTKEAEIDLLRLQTLTALERHDDALSVGREVLARFEQRADVKGTILSHLALADLAFRIDRPRDALRHYARVDRLLPADASPKVRGAVAMNRGNSLVACNRFHAAARHFDRARELFRTAQCEHSVAEVDYNAAYGELLRGRYREALRCYEECEQVFRRLDDARLLAHVDLDRAEIHLHLNLPEDAAQFAAAAEARFLTLGLSKERGQASLVYARAADLRGDLVTASRWYERAERIFQDLGLRERVVSCRVARAEVLRRQGLAADARTLADSARPLVTPETNAVTTAKLELTLARLAIDGDDTNSAIASAESVVASCRRIDAPWLRIEAMRVVGQARTRSRDPLPAIGAYESAILELERFRAGVPPDEYMAAFLSGQAQLYEEIVDLLVDTGQTARALDYAERAKSRALLDLAVESRATSGPILLDAQTGTRITFLRERLHAMYQQVFRREIGSRARSPSFSTRIVTARIEREIAALLRRRRLEDSRSWPADVAPDMAALRAQLDPWTAIVEYAVSAAGVAVFLVTRDEIHVVRSELAGLAELVARVRSRLTRESATSSEDTSAALREDLALLAERLLGPLRSRLSDMRRLVIVPHGALFRVPFHALAWGDRWLVDAFELVYAPSAAIYGLCRARRPSATEQPAVFCVPDAGAPEMEDECRQVARSVPGSRLYLGPEATFENLGREAANARILHIATHGMFRRERPTLSAFRLADRWVNLYDLYGIAVRGELVVLSTCESGTSDAGTGNDVLGLTRGLLCVGAPAVLATEWKVDDVAARLFMESFHGALNEGQDAASAHRSASRAVRERHPHPWHWAAFFLTGHPVDARRLARELRAPSSLLAQSRADAGHGTGASPSGDVAPLGDPAGGNP